MKKLFILLAVLFVACKQPVQIVEPVAPVVAPVAETPATVEVAPVTAVTISEASPVVAVDAPIAPELVATETPAPIVETVKISVVNSLWAIVKTDSLVVGSRDITSLAAIQEEITAHNAANTSDLWRLYEGEVPKIEKAPTVDIYIVKATTYEKVYTYLGVSRSDFARDKKYYDVDTAACAGVLFVDKVPPLPVPVVDTRPDYEKYALYLVSLAGEILFETHCEDFADAGYASAEKYYPERLRQFNFQAAANANGDYVVASKIYIRE